MGRGAGVGRGQRRLGFALGQCSASAPEDSHEPSQASGVAQFALPYHFDAPPGGTGEVASASGSHDAVSEKKTAAPRYHATLALKDRGSSMHA